MGSFSTRRRVCLTLFFGLLGDLQELCIWCVEDLPTCFPSLYLFSKLTPNEAEGLRCEKWVAYKLIGMGVAICGGVVTRGGGVTHGNGVTHEGGVTHGGEVIESLALWLPCRWGCWKGLGRVTLDHAAPVFLGDAV